MDENIYIKTKGKRHPIIAKGIILFPKANFVGGEKKKQGKNMTASIAAAGRSTTEKNLLFRPSNFRGEEASEERVVTRGAPDQEPREAIRAKASSLLYQTET